MVSHCSTIHLSPLIYCFQSFWTFQSVINHILINISYHISYIHNIIYDINISLFTLLWNLFFTVYSQKHKTGRISGGMQSILLWSEAVDFEGLYLLWMNLITLNVSHLKLCLQFRVQMKHFFRINSFPYFHWCEASNIFCLLPLTSQFVNKRK